MGVVHPSAAVRFGQCWVRCPCLRWRGTCRLGVVGAQRGRVRLLGRLECSWGAVLRVRCHRPCWPSSQPAVAPSPPPGMAGRAAGWEPAMRSRSLPSAESTVQSLFALARAVSLNTKPWQVPVVLLSAASCWFMWFSTHLLGDAHL